MQSQTYRTSATAMGWLICTLGALFYCYEYLLRITPGSMMPALMNSFHLNATGFGALVSLYYLAYTPMQAVVGVVHDVYGPRRVLVIALVICVIGNLLFSVTDSVTIASVARFLIGFGSAFAFVGVLKLATIWLPANRFAMIAGLATSLGMMGGMFGNMGLTAFVQKFGWRETLHAGTVIGVVLIPMMWFFIKNHSSSVKQTAANKVGYRETLLNLVQILKNPQLWLIGFIGSMLYSSLSAFAEVYGNQAIAEIGKFSQQSSAEANSMVFFGWLIGSPLFGWFSDRIGLRRLPMVIGCVAALIIFVIVLYVPNLPFSVVASLLFLFGFFCSAEVVCFAAGREIANPKLAATSVAFVNMIVMLAGMIFQPLIGKLLDIGWDHIVNNGMRIYSAHDFRAALSLIPLGLLVSIIATLKMRETHAKVMQN